MKKFRIQQDIQNLQALLSNFKNGQIDADDIESVKVDLKADDYKVQIPPSVASKSNIGNIHKRKASKKSKGKSGKGGNEETTIKNKEKTAKKINPFKSENEPILEGKQKFNFLHAILDMNSQAIQNER